jgi:hypothetical protein
MILASSAICHLTHRVAAMHRAQSGGTEADPTFRWFVRRKKAQERIRGCCGCCWARNRVYGSFAEEELENAVVSSILSSTSSKPEAVDQRQGEQIGPAKARRYLASGDSDGDSTPRSRPKLPPADGLNMPDEHVGMKTGAGETTGPAGQGSDTCICICCMGSRGTA